MKNKSLVWLVFSTLSSVSLYFFDIIGGETFLFIIVCLLMCWYAFIDCLSLEKGRNSSVLFVGIGAILFAGILGLILVWSLVDDYRFLTTGIQTTAQITDCQKNIIRLRRSVRVDHIHTIVYDGYTSKLNLSKQYPIGSQLSVRYLPTNPQYVTRMNSDATIYSLCGWSVWVLFLITCGLSCIGVLCLRGFCCPDSKICEEC